MIYRRKGFYSSGFDGYILANSFKEPSCKLNNVIDLNKVFDIELRADIDIVTKVSTASVARGVVVSGIGTLVGGATAKSKSSNSLK